MKKYWLIIILFAFSTTWSVHLAGQEITKTDVKEWIQGKEYYVHTVEQGQTLYSLSKAYDLPVDELLYENPDASEGLAIGQLIRIPVISREKQISEDLRNVDFRYIFHIVKKGETLYGIARIYDLEPDVLKKANPKWEEGLKEGQYLKIPVKAPEREGPDDGGVTRTDITRAHTVAAGETLFSISRLYKVSLASLRAVNPGLGNDLSVGQQISIPLKSEVQPEEPPKPKYTEHTVAVKETLYSIARKYRISIDSLKAFNPGLSENIFPGEVIRIPPGINPNAFITHEVREKTKLKKLAERYSLSVSEMKDANPDISSRIGAGETVMIPVGPPPANLTREPTVMEEEKVMPASQPLNDSIRCYRRKTARVKEFRVALMIPVYTEDVRDINLSEMEGEIDPDKYRSFNFVQFYEGFLMALDDLRQRGLQVRLYVYDVDDKVSKTIKVLQDPELTSMDLIIGPFFSRNFKLVSNFAEMFDIGIVNPLTRRSEVLNNPNVIKVKPSRDVQPEMLARFVRKYYDRSNIIIVRNNSFQYVNEAAAIRSELDRIMPYGVSVSNQRILDIIERYSEADTTLPDGTLYNNINVESRLLMTEQLERSLRDSTFFTNTISEVIYASDSIQGIIRNASVARNNLVIILTENEVFAPEILTRLNDLKDTFNITVVGLPEWGLFSNLETEYLLDLNVYFFTDSYVDYDDPKVIAFVENFRERFKTQPDQYAFEGHDLAGFFLGAMLRFGKDCMNCLPYYREKLLKTSMRFKPAYPSGYENLYWNLCRYKDYRIYKLPDL